VNSTDVEQRTVSSRYTL